MALYHFEIGFPQHVRLPLGGVVLQYSSHAQQAAKNDRYGKIVRLPSVLNYQDAKIIEIEADGKKVTKVLVRTPYNASFDISLAINPVNGFVKTVWLNKKEDKHYTLNRELYSIP